MEQVREGLRLFEAQSDVHGTAEALIALSVDTDQAGDGDSAVDLARRALELARATGDDWLIACALGAQMIESSETFQQTRRNAEQGLDMLRRRGDRIQLAVGLGNLGFAAMSAGDYAAAAPDLDEAVALTEELNDGRFLPFTIVNRGLLHVLQGADAAAARDFARALELCRGRGAAPRRRGAHRNRGDRSSPRRHAAGRAPVGRSGRSACLSGRSASRSYDSESTSSTPLGAGRSCRLGTSMDGRELAHVRSGDRRGHPRRAPTPIRAAGPALRRDPSRGPI